jgi:outer membrane protein assembly factor BamD (BamD/ComL family)
MKRFLMSSSIALVLALVASAAQVSIRAGQGKVAQGPEVSTVRDPDLESESKHNLEVARHYFKLKKAYRAAIARCEEIIAGDPTFTRVDEALYIAGMSSLRLSENRGKQAPTISADKLRDDAREYFSRIVNEFPESEFLERARNELSSLGGAKPKTEDK